MKKRTQILISIVSIITGWILSVLGWTYNTEVKHLNEALFLGGLAMFFAGVLWLVILFIYSLITLGNIKK